MPEWYYTKNGQQAGPVTDQDLRTMAGTGQLQPGDMVWREGMGNWAPAAQVSGLFSAGAQPTSVVQPAAGFHAPTPAAMAPGNPQPWPQSPAAPYGAAQPHYAMGFAPAPRPAGLAVASMVLGIIACVLFCVWYLAIPCAIIAISLGAVALGKVKRGVGGGEGMAKAGLALGIISIALDVILIIFAASFFASVMHGFPR